MNLLIYRNTYEFVQFFYVFKNTVSRHELRSHFGHKSVKFDTAHDQHEFDLRNCDQT